MQRDNLLDHLQEDIFQRNLIQKILEKEWKSDEYFLS